MKTIGKLAALTATASAAFLMVSPASAEGNTSATSAATAQTSSKKASADKKYCMALEPLTGSRMSKKACRTKAEWAADGIEVTSKS